MSVTYNANTVIYNANQGDMWDMIALREYGDEHAMNTIQDANYSLRFTDAFFADTKVTIPGQAVVQNNLKVRTSIPNTGALLPWR